MQLRDAVCYRVLPRQGQPRVSRGSHTVRAPWQPRPLLLWWCPYSHDDLCIITLLSLLLKCSHTGPSSAEEGIFSVSLEHHVGTGIPIWKTYFISSTVSFPQAPHSS